MWPAGSAQKACEAIVPHGSKAYRRRPRLGTVYWFVLVSPTAGTVLNGFDPAFFQASSRIRSVFTGLAFSAGLMSSSVTMKLSNRDIV
jgi:hypothetical protein